MCPVFYYTPGEFLHRQIIFLHRLNWREIILSVIFIRKSGIIIAFSKPYSKTFIMKTLIKIFISFVLLFAIGCKKSSTESTTSTEVTPVNSAIIKGQWKISYFMISGNNKTTDFTDFKLTFNTSGLLTGANSLLAENGSWSLTSESNKTKLTIDFSTTNLLKELTGDWEITSRSSATIVMQKSSGTGQTDYLTIDKIS